MIKTFKTATDFRKSLEKRLKKASQEKETVLKEQYTQLKLLIPIL